MNHNRGANHPRWNDDRIISSNGYVKIRVGALHPLADSKGFAYEHLLVWVTAGNQKPTDDFNLHHINGIKTDNRLENLRLEKKSDHSRYHAQLRQRDIRGRFIYELRA